ncbi:hypothetical protein [Nocardioides sp.]|uniref:hypothetical protein n=1 Tax=Nocardioides sp. TaxID=35761 RepID=UPI001A21275D|nr:hypothetical protein [Nocardioides sp.]MBJ7359719.1 hypothetical protein [Nocardioides sp.]
MGLNPFKAKREAAQAEADQLRSLARLAREDLVELGERLEDEAPPAEPAALAEREKARALTAEARPRLREAETSDAVLAVQETICQAFVHLARSDAIARGEEPPTRTDPCAFNPQHGPAVTMATWAPIGGTPTTYSCCQQDADLIAAGRAPRRRTLTLDGGGNVAWDELGSAPRSPREMRSRGMANDYEAVAMAMRRAGTTHQLSGGARP